MEHSAGILKCIKLVGGVFCTRMHYSDSFCSIVTFVSTSYEPLCTSTTLQCIWFVKKGLIVRVHDCLMLL